MDKPFGFRVNQMARLTVEIEADQPNRKAKSMVRGIVMLVFHLLKPPRFTQFRPLDYVPCASITSRLNAAASARLMNTGKNLHCIGIIEKKSAA